jgi:hypothetical protein
VLTPEPIALAMVAHGEASLVPELESLPPEAATK